MGLTEFLASAMDYLHINEVAHADAPEKDDEEESKDNEGGDENEEKDGGDDKDGKEGDDEDKEEGGDDEEKGKDEGGDDEEEEEEEEEEPVDPKPALEEECAKSSQCRGYKHHYDECVERVMAHENDPEAHKGHHKEDCVEEFFHLQHCATACAAPKLFKQLK